MELVKVAPSEFDFIYGELVENFIEDERREYKEAKEVFQNEDFIVFNAILDGEKVGFVTVWNLTDFLFIEHFVVYKQFRNKGYGGKILQKLKELNIPLVLESEPPISDFAIRRLEFYKRNGFVANPEKYYQPPYRKNGNKVELILHSYPTLLKNQGETVSQIYEKVYKI